MPDQFGNPTFKDLFEDPEVLRRLYNNPSRQPSPLEEAFNYSAPAQVPLPSPLSQDERIAGRAAITSGGLTDLAGIYLGQAPQGRSEAALQNYAGQFRAVEDKTRAVQSFNAQQENQFGRESQRQQFLSAQLAEKQAAITARTGEKIDSQTEEAKRNREAADTRAEADRKARVDLENQKFEHDKQLESMKESARIKEATAKGNPAADKVAAQYQDTAARIDQARKQLDIMKAHYESALGISPASKGQPTKSRGVSGFAGAELQEHPSVSWMSGYLGQGGKDAQLHETYRGSLATSLAPLLSGSKRAVIGVLQAIKPTLPAFRDEPSVAAEKYKNVQMLLDISGSLPGANPQQRAAARAALREKIISFATDPNVKANMMRAFAAADADLDKDEIAAPVVGQRVPSPPPPPPGTDSFEERLRKIENK